MAINAENSSNVEGALAAYERLVSNYPQSKERGNALFNRARLLEVHGRPREAAPEYLRYARLYPKDEDAPKCMFRAGLLYELLGEDELAISAFRLVPDVPVDAQRHLGDCLRRRGKDAQARIAYTAAAEAFDAGRQLDALDAVAAASFQLAEYELHAFQQLRNVDQKTRRLSRVSSAYRRVIDYGVPEWERAARFRTANAMEHIPELKGAAIARYRELVNGGPAGDDWVKAAQEALDRLDR